jgi:dihydroflavonol-4-reductase
VTIAITGATGVVGGAILRHLLATGEPIRALVRSGVHLPPPVESVQGDVLDPPTLVRAFAGVDTVFHVAGVNQMCGPDPTYMFRVNVEGTRNVLQAVASAGCRRLVYTSSAASLGEAEGEVGNEATVPVGRFESAYARSKFAAEQVVRTEGAALDVVTLNPSSVQGPGRATGTARLLLGLVNGHLSTLIDTRVSIVDIDDCARGHLLAGVHGVRGERYILNSFSMTVQEAVTLIENAIGTQLKVRYLPAGLALAAGALIGGAFRLIGRQAPLCPESVRTLRHGHVYDGSRATRELGLVYTPADQTVKRLIDWARAQGLVGSS